MLRRDLRRRESFCIYAAGMIEYKKYFGRGAV
nr:MAG TPA: hypothetical protein [Caudoviricetes sp.]